MQACKERCDENENSRNPYTNKVAYLENIEGKDMPYLVISDYNTTGMEYTNDKQCGFNAGVRQMGASHKGTGNAGGSHGLGKVVGFVASEINTVYYSTMTATDNSTYGEGVTRLCTHSVRGKEFFPDAFMIRMKEITQTMLLTFLKIFAEQMLVQVSTFWGYIRTKKI